MMPRVLVKISRFFESIVLTQPLRAVAGSTPEPLLSQSSSLTLIARLLALAQE